MQTLDLFFNIDKRLDNTLQSFRTEGLPHSLLILGQKGTGKNTLGLLLSQMQLCTAELNNRPCGTCSNCIRVAQHTHPAFLFAGEDRQANSIKIDDIRSIVERLSIYNIEGDKRAVLLIDADRMTVQAQNALLKSLEEPDKQTYFILTANNKQSLLPTVLSRCTQLNMPLWSEERIYDYLIKSNIDNAKKIAALSEGSIGRALRYSSDDNFHKILAMVDETIAEADKISAIPALSAKWKSLKDDGELIISLLENRCTQQIYSTIDTQKILHLNKMLDSLMQARKLLKSNVSWQAIADYLLFHILEDLNLCHQ
ncbi:MAG: AAA family ATPase [Eubacteriales bacterium]|nr:AAA family ATPase [Eubacteriales bacterium]